MTTLEDAEKELYDYLSTFLSEELLNYYHEIGCHLNEYNSTNVKSKRLKSIYNTCVNYISILYYSTGIEFDAYFMKRYKLTIRINQLNVPRMKIDSGVINVVNELFKKVLDIVEATTIKPMRKQHTRSYSEQDNSSTSEPVIEKTEAKLIQTPMFQNTKWASLTKEQRSQVISEFSKVYVYNSILFYHYIDESQVDTTIHALETLLTEYSENGSLNIKWDKAKGIISQVQHLKFVDPNFIIERKLVKKVSFKNNQLTEKHEKKINDIVVSELVKGNQEKSEIVEVVKTKLKLSKLSPQDRKKIHTSFEKIKQVMSKH